MTRLIQIQKGNVRAVALVDEPRLRVVKSAASILELANQAIQSRAKLTDLVRSRATGEALDYDPIYSGKSEWRILPAIDHPDEPARCLVSGTGLTHLGSAKNRNSMHNAETQLTDSMKMFQWGVERGKPVAGKVGVAPEWFFKGVGTVLKGHQEPLTVPFYAEDGGEEAEIAGIYVIDPDGFPCRVGMAIGNEFSDHRFEKHNYLFLAGSKIRTCAIGPELVIDPEFQTVPGTAKIVRSGKEIWSKEIATGEAEMCHSLANIEHHHFKFESHRRPGDVHVHYFGAISLSFGDGVQLIDGDVMEVAFKGFGRALKNPLRVLPTSDKPVAVRPLG